MATKTKIFIPARMQASRFPNKPLADILGMPMIIRVMQQAKRANIGEVVVACGDQIIYDTVVQHGGIAVLTDADVPSGTDRIYQALTKLGDSVDTVINVQGDIPTIAPSVIQAVADVLQTGDFDMSTACAEIITADDIHNPNVVKAYGDFTNSTPITTATAFLRTATGDPPFYHHIGLYGYTADALKRFVSLPPSQNEITHRLEQLRAMDAGFKIALCVVDDVPLGIDTPDDLHMVCNVLQNTL